MNNPNQCSGTMCPNPLGPDAIEFTHNGEHAGGLCRECIEGNQQFRVLFRRDEKGQLQAEEMQIVPG